MIVAATKNRELNVIENVHIPHLLCPWYVFGLVDCTLFHLKITVMKNYYKKLQLFFDSMYVVKTFITIILAILVVVISVKCQILN